MSATAPASLAKRTRRFSRSYSDSRKASSASAWRARAAIAAGSPCPAHDGGVGTGRDHPVRATQLLEPGRFDDPADARANHLGAGEHRDVTQRVHAIGPEGRRLHRHGREAPLGHVQDEQRERVAGDLVGDDQQRSALLGDGGQHRHELANLRDALVRCQDVGLLENAFAEPPVARQAGRQQAVVEAHSLVEVELDSVGPVILDPNHAVGADPRQGVGHEFADVFVSRCDRGDASQVTPPHRAGLSLDPLACGRHG